MKMQGFVIYEVSKADRFLWTEGNNETASP